MSSAAARLIAARRLDAPSWLAESIVYETLMGSVAYGVSSDTSDRDVYGFCVPPKPLVFPHLAGEIPGFGTPKPRFEQLQNHHVSDPDALAGKGCTWDFTLFSIVKFFHLAMENNPNVVDSLFTPESCVLHQSPVGRRVRERRRLFLHRGAWAKFRGYAYAQLHKLDIKAPEPGTRRAESVERFGYDVKFAYHIVRLLDEAEQILTGGDIDLTRDAERLKAIRRGEWTLEQVRSFFARREPELERAFAESPLPPRPDEPAIRSLLLECLEAHYGSVADAVGGDSEERALLRQIKALCERAGV